MAKSVTIKVEKTGQNFAQCAVVKQGRKTVYVSANVPYGMGHVAHSRAAAWAEKNGYTVRA